MSADGVGSSGINEVKQIISQSTNEQIAFQAYVVQQQAKQASSSALFDTQTAAIRSSKDAANGLAMSQKKDGEEHKQLQN